MKSLFLLLPTLLASTATACVTAHVYQQDCFINIQDVLSAQVFDNGVEVCNGAASIAHSSNLSTFCVSGCLAGYSFCVTGNVRSATYTNPNYEVTMGVQGLQENEFTCAETDDSEFKGLEFEGCFTDEFFNCGSYAQCQTCDFEAYC